MKKILLAIDPGAKGGIAALFPNGSIDVQTIPETVHDLASHIERFQILSLVENCSIRAYVEQVNGFIGKAQPGSAMFHFGQNYGQILGVLSAYKIPFVLVTPQKWQKGFALGKAERVKVSADATPEARKLAESKNAAAKRDWKKSLRARSQQLFPDKSVTLTNCDALLILEYARQIEGSQKVTSGELL